jgi:hypothetical protein
MRFQIRNSPKSSLHSQKSKEESPILKPALKNSDGLEEIRTPDLRHVKATS